MIDWLKYIYKPESALEAQTRRYWEWESHLPSNVVRVELLQRLDIQISTLEQRLTDLRRRVDYWQYQYVADFPRFKLAKPETLEQGLELLEHLQRDRELAVYAQHCNLLRVMRRAWDLLDNNRHLLRALVDSYDERMLSAAQIQATIRALYPAVDCQTTLHDAIGFGLPTMHALYGLAPIACYVDRATNWRGRDWGRLVPCTPFTDESHWDEQKRRLYLYFRPVLESYLAAYYKPDNRLYLVKSSIIVSDMRSEHHEQ